MSLSPQYFEQREAKRQELLAKGSVLLEDWLEANQLQMDDLCKAGLFEAAEVHCTGNLYNVGTTKEARQYVRMAPMQIWVLVPSRADTLLSLIRERLDQCGRPAGK